MKTFRTFIEKLAYTLLVNNSLAKILTLLVPQPLLINHMTLYDIFVYPKLKMSLKGKLFDTIEKK